MNISKKRRSKAEQKYSRLVGKTEDEINNFLYNKGFKKGENDFHIKKIKLSLRHNTGDILRRQCSLDGNDL